jgi:hypothetical protein
MSGGSVLLCAWYTLTVRTWARPGLLSGMLLGDIHAAYHSARKLAANLLSLGPGISAEHWRNGICNRAAILLNPVEIAAIRD